MRGHERDPLIDATAAELRHLEHGGAAGTSATGSKARGPCCARPGARADRLGFLAEVGPGPVLNLDPDLCEAFPLGKHRTNDNFVFLREILQGETDPLQAGVCLAAWLARTAIGVGQPDGQANEPSVGGVGVLVIDQLVEIKEPLAIPHRMTISGVGINGAGVLRFFDLPPGTEAITFISPDPAEVPSYVTIQDLVLEYVQDGVAEPPGTGVDAMAVHGTGDIVYLRRLMVRNWDRGLVNSHGYSVIVEQCTFENNGMHVDVVQLEANALRLRECVFRGASGPAVNLNSPGIQFADPDPDDAIIPSTINANSCLITGCYFTGNAYGVYVDRHQSATIIGNSFVGNTVDGIYVTSNAREARIIANTFDHGDRFDFAEAELNVRVGLHHHQYGFNTIADPIDDEDYAEHEVLAVERIYTIVIDNLPAP